VLRCCAVCWQASYDLQLVQPGAAPQGWAYLAAARRFPLDAAGLCRRSCSIDQCSMSGLAQQLRQWLQTNRDSPAASDEPGTLNQRRRSRAFLLLSWPARLAIRKVPHASRSAMAPDQRSDTAVTRAGSAFVTGSVEGSAPPRLPPRAQRRQRPASFPPNSAERTGRTAAPALKAAVGTIRNSNRNPRIALDYDQIGSTNIRSVITRNREAPGQATRRRRSARRAPLNQLRRTSHQRRSAATGRTETEARPS